MPKGSFFCISSGLSRSTSAGVESSFHVGKKESRSTPFRAASVAGGVASLSPSRVLAFVSELAELRRVLVLAYFLGVRGVNACVCR